MTDVAPMELDSQPITADKKEEEQDDPPPEPNSPWKVYLNS